MSWRRSYVGVSKRFQTDKVWRGVELSKYSFSRVELKLRSIIVPQQSACLADMNSNSRRKVGCIDPQPESQRLAKKFERFCGSASRQRNCSLGMGRRGVEDIDVELLAGVFKLLRC